MMQKKGQWTPLGKEKLLSSGLTSAQGSALGMYEVASAAKLDPKFEARPALVIPYFGLDKEPLASHPKWPPFFRARYLDDKEQPKGFKDVAGAKAQRYVQQMGSGVCAYFPTSVNWKEVAKDVDYDIVVTEGELKAAAACAQNVPTIGLGGVWNFRSSKDGVWWLPELEGVNWVKRTTFICFDSDYISKPNVCMAINALCDELQERGAIVRLLILPDGDDEKKVGLDDYLLSHTRDDLIELMTDAPPIGMSRALWRMNNEVVYVEDPGLVINDSTMQKMSPDQFKSHSRWATASATETKISAKGDVVRDKVPAAPVWLRWPLRRTVRKLAYAPGQDIITADGDLNQWKGWGVEPVRGTVKPWLDLSKFIFAHAEKGVLDWFYDWCAYPVQNPGMKMFSGVVIHGVAQGTGKTLLGYTLARIYGDNYKEITDDDLEETYWAENKQFILGDEVSGKDNRQYMNTLKRLITKDSIDINIKFIPQYQLANCMNFMFTSQHGDSFFLEDKDRRFFVVEVLDDPMPRAFYKEYDKWYKGEGASFLMQWLLDRKIGKDFDPFGPPPFTAAKERMIAATKGDAGAWVYDLKNYPEQILTFGEQVHTRDLFSSRELLQMYERDHPNSRLTAVGLGRQLSAAGMPQAMGGRTFAHPATGRMERFFAVRNADVWKQCKDPKRVEANLKMQMKRVGKTTVKKRGGR